MEIINCDTYLGLSYCNTFVLCAGLLFNPSMIVLPLMIVYGSLNVSGMCSYQKRT